MEKVAGASIDGTNNLRPWMRLAGLPWVDATCDDLPTDVDLLVIDVGQGARTVEVLRPSLTLIPVDRSAAERSAATTAASVVGDVLRVWNLWHGRAVAVEPIALPSLTERELKGAARLGDYFERFAAMKKAEAENCPPKQWMIEWARDLESRLAKKR